MRQGLRVRAWSATNVGRVREGNEDSLFQGTTAFAVADGMGGHQAGEVASETALRPVAELDGVQYPTPADATEALAEAIASANQAVYDKAFDDPGLRGMGTTLTAMLVREGRFHLAHVGDSRAYLLRSGDISRLTTDHTLVQQLIDEGRLSSDQADTHPQRSVITRAIGVEQSVEVDSLQPLEMLPGDQILLCSDGLTGPVKDEEIARILDEYEDGGKAVHALIDAANEAGGPDNITVVLLRVEATSTNNTSVESRTRSGDTQDLGPPVSLSTAPAGPVTQIRTRPEASTEFDAKTFGRYGRPQGAEGTPPEPGGRTRRVAAGVLGLLLLLAILIGGGYILFSRAFFIGDDNGQVAIFQGFSQNVGGLPLNRVVERTQVRTADLSPRLQERIRNGDVSMDDIGSARDYVERTLVPIAEQAERERQLERERQAAPPPLPPGVTPAPAPSPAAPPPSTSL